MGNTALHEAAIKGNAKMVAYMMEQVNPNVDARDVVGGWVGPRIMGAKLRMMIEWDPLRTAAMQLRGSFRWYTEYGLEHDKGFLNEVLMSNSCTSMCFQLW